MTRTEVAKKIQYIMTTYAKQHTPNTPDYFAKMWDKSSNNVGPIRIYLGERGSWGYISIGDDGTPIIRNVKRHCYQNLMTLLDTNGIKYARY